MRWLIMAAALAAACSSTSENSDTDGGVTGGDGTLGLDATPQPPETHAVCGQAPPAELGQGCSASGYGDLCTSEDTTCGSLSCVIDSRQGGIDTYCAPACTTETDCPLGYACVDQHPQCVGAVTGKVCAQTGEVGCSKVALPAGAVLNFVYASLFEDRAGKRYLVAGNYQSSAALYRQDAGSWTQLLSWSDGTDTSVREVRGDESTTLVPLRERVLVLQSGQASEEPRPASGSLIFGMDGSGHFIALESTSSSTAYATYATVYRREAAGSWAEIGPTLRKLVGRPSSLQQGFVGVCSSAGETTELCASEDGQTYQPIALPPGTALNSAGSPAAGASVADFFIVLSGRLFHRRGGTWVEEGPPPGYVPQEGNSHGYHSRTLQLGADGSVIYGHDGGEGTKTDISTYLLTGDCWRPVNAAFPATPWGGALAWLTSSNKLCQLPTQ